MIDRRNLLKRMTASVLAGRFAGIAGPSSLSPSLPGPNALHLDRNENAYGPSKNAIEALQQHAGTANRYPHTAEFLGASLAKFLGVPAEQILLGAGTEEILRMSVAAFLSPQRKLVMARPSYDAIAPYAHAVGAEIVSIPLRKDHGHDLDAMLASVDARTGVVYICNPNNPTGTLTDRHNLETFIRALPEPVLLILDEAYHEYAGTSSAYRTAISYGTQRENMIVTRTFSKVYGLAGLRLGFAVGSQSVLARLALQKLSLGLNEFALIAGEATLRDKSHVERCVRQNQDDRQEFVNQVNARMLRVLDSHANFACLNVMRPSEQIIAHFKKNNVILPPEILNMPTYVRVSLGLPQEMAEFWRVWDLLGSHPMAM